MKKVLISALLLSFSLGSSASHAAENPCEDAMYVNLEEKGIDNMTAREYQTFERLGQQCSSYKQQSSVLSQSDKAVGKRSFMTTLILIIPGILLMLLL